MAECAVSLFIIISGFVITNLLLKKQEAYTPYIARRFLRIFPVYLICLAVGIVTTDLTFQAFLDRPWGDNTPHHADLVQQSASLATASGTHLLAHLLLLQGVIPDSVLYASQQMFLSPAWSLSLEWQFYLIAPLIVWAMAKRTAGIAVSLLAACAYIAYAKGVFGSFALPSFLPGGILLLMAGIITRLALPGLPCVRQSCWRSRCETSTFCLLWRGPLSSSGCNSSNRAAPFFTAYRECPSSGALRQFEVFVTGGSGSVSV